MRNTSGFTSWRILVLVFVVGAVGFALTRIATSLTEEAPVSKTGGIDNAMAQARRLLAELPAVDWNGDLVDRDLVRLPEQDHVRDRFRRQPGVPSFTFGHINPQYSEVAFFCDTFVEKTMRIVPGEEGEVTKTGFFIVGWKNGLVNTVDVGDVRLFPLPNRDKVWIVVFPGMDEYNVGLKRYAPVITATQGSSGAGS